MKSGKATLSGGTLNRTGNYIIYQTGGTLGATGYSWSASDRNYFIYLGGGTSSLSSCTVTNTYSSGTCYGVYVGGSAATFTSCTISATSSSYWAYGVYVNSGSATISGGTVKGTSTGTSTSSVGCGAYGSVTVTGSATVTGTSSMSWGYGLYVGTSSQTASVQSGTVTGSNTGNTTADTAGAYVAAGSLTVSGGTVKGTSSYFVGDGIDVYGGSVTVTGGTLSGSGSSKYSNYGVYAVSGTITLSGGTASATDPLYVAGGTMKITGGSWSTSNTYTVYVQSGTLNLSGGTVSNLSSSGYAVYNNGGNVYGDGSTVYHDNGGYAFYNKKGYFNIDSGKYYARGTAIYVADTSYGCIGGNHSDKSDLEIYKSLYGSVYSDPVVEIAGGYVEIFGCYIHSQYGPALSLTGSADVCLGPVFSTGTKPQDSYMPEIAATISGQYAIYVAMTDGDLLIYGADIYGVDYGIYIYDGYVASYYVWITLSESSNDAYAIYVENRTTSYFSLKIILNEYVTAESMSSKKTVYGIYSANKNNTSSISYAQISYTTPGKSSIKTS